MYSYLLFDLDGTVSDPKVGITRCVQYALSDFGIEEPDLDKLEPFIGPPLRDSFMKYYGFTPEQAQQAVDKYRERFSVQGLYENEIYPGMGELLRDLKEDGCHLAIASSKPTVYVEKILQYFGIRQYFEVVVGSELNGVREKKEDVVSEALHRLFGENGIDYAHTAMIGDREFDMYGAKQMGIHSIGVTFGFAGNGELEAAGAEIIVQSVDGLRRILLGDRELRKIAAFGGGDMAGSDGRNSAVSGGAASDSVISGNTASAKAADVNWAERYRTPEKEKKESGKGSLFLQALLAIVLFFGIATMVISIATIVYMFIGGMMGKEIVIQEQSMFLNIVNSAANLIAVGACVLIWKKDIGWKKTKHTEKISLIPMIILAATVSVGLNALISVSGIANFSKTFQEVSQMQNDIPIWLEMLLFGVAAPVAEELLMRGIVYQKLKKGFGVPLGILLSAVAFGLIHGNLVQFVYATILGIIMGYVCEIYGSVKYAVLFHAAANLSVVILLDWLNLGYVIVYPAAWLTMLALAAVSGYFMYRWQTEEKEA